MSSHFVFCAPLDEATFNIRERQVLLVQLDPGFTMSTCMLQRMVRPDLLVPNAHLSGNSHLLRRLHKDGTSYL